MTASAAPSRVAFAPRLFRFLKRAVVATGLLASASVVDSIAGEIYDWKGGATPPLSLPTTNGAAMDLASLRGRVVLVNFWATWCEPCVAEMPSLDGVRRQFGADVVEVVGVNMGETQTKVARFVEKLNVTFPILLDRDGVAKSDWKVGGVPVTFVIGRDGRIAFRIVGETDFSEPTLVARIRALAAKAPSARNNVSSR